MSRVFRILPHEIWDVIIAEVRRNWVGIIFHHSAYEKDYDQAVLIDQWHVAKGWKGIGYHFVVNRSGVLETTFRWIRQMSGAHCKGYNSYYIGICLSGNLENQQATGRQIITMCELLRHLGMRICAPHSLFKNTLCPGRNFPWADVYEVVIFNPKKRRSYAGIN